MRRPAAVLLSFRMASCAVAAIVGSPQTVYRARTDSVAVDVSVRNHNSPVAGLQSDDFQLYDNGKLQPVETVSLGAVPIDVTMFIDTSGTTSGDLDHLRADVRTMTAMLRLNDRVRVFTFSDQVHDVSGWQSPVGGVDVDSIVEGTSSSPVYDALFLALMHKPDLDRRHLVVAMTDGMDNGSWMDSATVRDIARRADSVLHVVIIPEGNPTARNGSPSRYAWRSLVDGSSDANLEAAATLTGGEFHRAPFFDTRNRVINAFKEAFDDFRLSYLLRYTPQGVAPTGWHDLRVQVTHHPDYTVRARKGYFGD